MARGDHLVVRRSRWYAHHAVDLGDGTVVHYTGDRRQGRVVARDRWDDFAAGGEVLVRKHVRPLPVERIAREALACVGDTRYSLVRNNCEHFATWCCTSRARSRQVRHYVALTTHSTLLVLATVLDHMGLLVLSVTSLGAQRIRQRWSDPRSHAPASAAEPAPDRLVAAA